MNTPENITTPDCKESESSTEISNESETVPIGKDILQYFNSLNWNVVERSQYKNCLTSFLPSEEGKITKSHALALVYSQRHQYPEQEYNIKELLNEEIESCDYYVPGVKEKMIFIPSQSALSKKEQHLLYAFLCRIKFNNPPLNDRELVQYQELLLKSRSDHNDFQKYVRLQWINHHCRRSLEIPAPVVEYIDKLWKNQLKKCLALYPPLYMQKTHIPLMLNDPNNDYSVMDFIKDITTRGSYQKLMFPRLSNPCELITDLNTLCKITSLSEQEFSEEEKPVVKPLIAAVLPASIDPVVNMCIEKENIDVVITPSGIKTIVDRYQCHKDWILPVTVKNVLKVKGELNKKVIIIDKKLPPCAMSIYDKNVKHAKITSKWALVLCHTPSLFDTLRCNEQKPSEYDATGSDVVDQIGMDVCSSVTSSKATTDQHLSSAVINKEKVCNKMESLSIIGNGIEENKQPNNELEHMSQNNGKRKSMSDSPPAIPSIANETLGRHKLIAKRHNSMQPWRKYALWELHKSTHFNMSKQEQRSLRILVRNIIDGNLNYIKNNKSTTTRVFVSPKLEYQPEFGASKMTTSELVRNYVDLVIRRLDLCRLRVVGHTKELMLAEVKSLQEIKECLQQVHKVQTQKVFDPLYAVLTKLIDLPVGRYMLRHTPKMEAFSQLLVESEQNFDFNLISHCERQEAMEVNLPAAQIDPFVLTRIHFRERKPPAVLRALDAEQTGKFLKKTTNFVSCKKKKKKRGKKKGKIIKK